MFGENRPVFCKLPSDLARCDKKLGKHVVEKIDIVLFKKWVLWKKYENIVDLEAIIMLQNELCTQIGFDTTETEPSKGCYKVLPVASTMFGFHFFSAQAGSEQVIRFFSGSQRLSLSLPGFAVEFG